MSKSVLVSVASSSGARENYCKAQLNLIKSAMDCTNHQRNWFGDFLIRSVDGYCDEYMGVPIQLGSWPVTEKYGVSWSHQNRPYGFKPFAVWEAIEKGYTRILWCDSTIRIMKNPDPLWERCAEHGILAWNNEGHPLMPYTPMFMEKWLTDNHFSLGHEQIMACCIMFDASKDYVRELIEWWVNGAIENCFHNHDEEQRPGFVANRHDQALLSHLMHHCQIPVQPYGYLAYRHYKPENAYFINWGVQ